MLNSDAPTSRWLAAMSVHAFTAAGAFCAFMALIEIINGFLAPAFGWLGIALLIDGIDGTLARALKTAEHAPRWNGATLDLVVDFLTYVIVPLVAVWQAGLLPDAIAAPLCGLIASGSAFYFADNRMKTQGNWFAGFPALWNVAAFYLFCFPLPPLANAIVLALLAVLMFAPIHFVHPTRVLQGRPLTLVVTGAWVLAAGWIIITGFGPNVIARTILIAAAAYGLAQSVMQALGRRTA